MDSTSEPKSQAAAPSEHPGQAESEHSGSNFPSIDEDWDSDRDSAIGSIRVQPRLYDQAFMSPLKRTALAIIDINKAREQERLDIQHTLWRVTFHGKLFQAPVKDPKHVLDIATGTGIWAIEFANEYPNSIVLGTDLSPIQPTYLPPNCSFEINDAEDEWVFPHPLDYIHGRALVSCFTDPSYVIRQAFKSLAPGGYLELNDACVPMQYVGPPPTESYMYRWNSYGMEAASKSGRSLTNVQHYARWMREAGFEDVVEKSFYWPTSPWPRGTYLKRVAVLFREDLTKNLDGLTMKLYTTFLGWSPEQVKEFTKGIMGDFWDTNIHAYMPIKSVYGRKPLAKTEP